tara:strand:+ start:163 stop:324 length:162 start_codon:yes stop_codon:yes gene_type:complete
MQIDPSQEPEKIFIESPEDNNKNMTCKDGFCFLPNIEKNEPISSENLNIFDPI